MKIKKELTPDGFREYVDAIRSCGDHPIANLTDSVLASVVEVLDCYIEEAEDYEDTKGRVVVRLSSGQYGVFSEWSDSSGHG
jgi:hypothetical protein